jgi:hypothetical protein
MRMRMRMKREREGGDDSEGKKMRQKEWRDPS